MNHELALSFVAALHQAVEERKKLLNLELELKKNLNLDSRVQETFLYKKQIDKMNLQYDISLRRTRQLDQQVEQLQSLLGSQVKNEIYVEYNGHVYMITVDADSGFASCVKHKEKPGKASDY